MISVVGIRHPPPVGVEHRNNEQGYAVFPEVDSAGIRIQVGLGQDEQGLQEELSVGEHHAFGKACRGGGVAQGRVIVFAQIRPVELVGLLSRAGESGKDAL